MSTAITGTTATTASYAADAMKKSIGMNKDDFLKLFITELQHQDPMDPMDPTEMLGQLAQLTQVEQAYNTTAALEKLLVSQDNSLAMTSVSLIGKEVTASGSQVGFDGSNPAELSFQMPAATNAATVRITNSAGQTVRTVNLGDLAAGNGTYQWDGKDGQGNSLLAGAYSFSVTGNDALGNTLAGTSQINGTVDGVEFKNGIAYLKIGSVSVPFTDVTSVKG